jgi:hypothetical protein
MKTNNGRKCLFGVPDIINNPSKYMLEFQNSQRTTGMYTEYVHAYRYVQSTKPNFEKAF